MMDALMFVAVAASWTAVGYLLAVAARLARGKRSGGADGPPPAMPARWGRQTLEALADALHVDYRRHPLTGAQVEAPANGATTVHFERLVTPAEGDAVVEGIRGAAVSHDAAWVAVRAFLGDVEEFLASASAIDADARPTPTPGDWDRLFGEGGAFRMLAAAYRDVSQADAVRVVFDVYHDGAFLGTLSGPELEAVLDGAS